MKKYLLPLAVVCLVATPAYAEMSKQEIKASLVTAWEKAQKEDENNISFAPTSKKDTYTLETAYFPYKGEVEVVNIVVDKNPEYESDNVYYGFVETRLLDKGAEKKDLYSKYPAGFDAWNRKNRLYFDPVGEKWYTPQQWKNKPYVAPTPAKSVCTASSFTKFLSDWGFAIFFVIFFLIALFLGRKQNKKLMNNQDYFRKATEESAVMVKESLAAQHAHTALLQNILSELKRK